MAKKTKKNKPAKKAGEGISRHLVSLKRKIETGADIGTSAMVGVGVGGLNGLAKGALDVPKVGETGADIIDAGGLVATVAAVSGVLPEGVSRNVGRVGVAVLTSSAGIIGEKKGAAMKAKRKAAQEQAAAPAKAPVPGVRLAPEEPAEAKAAPIQREPVAVPA